MNAHYLNENWERVTFNLACVPFDESHTGEHINHRLMDVLNDWDITQKTGVCLRDNANNMKACFTVDDCILEDAGCMNHTIQLTLDDAIFSLPSVEALTAKCRRLASYANQSVKFYDVFYRNQRNMNPPITDRRSIKQDVTTR